MRNSRTNYSNAPSVAIGFIYVEVFHSCTLSWGVLLGKKRCAALLEWLGFTSHFPYLSRGPFLCENKK